MKKIIVFSLILMAFVCEGFAQNASVTSALKSKYSMAQYYPECGGWYFISYQKDGQTLYGFTDKNGNVIAQDASKYKLHKGYIELYLLDMAKKAEHDRWILDMKQYNIDYQNYKRTQAKYENELRAYKAKYQAAEGEAERRWKNAREYARQKAQYEQQQQQRRNGSGGGVLGAILQGVASGISITAAVEAVKYQPFLDQVLAERDLSVKPSEPYNPMPTQPREPSTGYYWKSFSLLQPCPYEYIDFEAIEEVGHFANVKKDGKWGLVDSYMREVVACTNSSKVYQSKIKEGIFVIKNGGYTGVIDSNGKTIIPCQYSSVTKEEGKLKVCQNSKYGLFDFSGKEIMPCIFDKMQSSNGYLLCQKDKLWGVYTSDFEELYPCQFQNANFGNMNGKLILNTQLRGLWGVVDFESGQSLLPNNYSKINSFLAGSTQCYQVHKDNKMGLYSANGVLLLPCEFDNISVESSSIGGYIKVTKNTTAGIYDGSFIPRVKEDKYNGFTIDDSGWIHVSQAGRKGICSTYGAELVPCKYDNLVWDKDNGFFKASIGGKMTLVTTNGVELFEPVMAKDLEIRSYNDHIIVHHSGYPTTYSAMDYNGTLIDKPQKKYNKLFKKVEKYKKKNDITTIKQQKLALVQDANQKISKFFQTERNEKAKFSFYAQNYVGKVINEWQKRGEFEKVDDWRKRVNNETRSQKVYSLTKEAQNIYVANNTRGLKDDNIRIVGSYDADNETYRIKSSLLGGKELLVKVPTDDAQEFKATFHSLKKKPTFFVENDGIGLAEYTFTMPNGKSFKYSNKASLTYSVAQVDYNFDAIEIDKSASNNNFKGGKQTISTKNMIFGTSDVDVNIPQATTKQENTYAIIIANENYENEKKVEFAYNDGQVFRDYCIKALGIPEDHIHFKDDATLNHITFEVNWIKQMAKACDGKAKFIFYYSGHGVPEEDMQDAYLLPVDGFHSDLASGYKLSNLYKALSDIPAENVLVLLDACFSGAQRNGEHLASVKGVARKVKLSEPKGNMVVFSAAAGSQTAQIYEKKYHGLFTYFLLKKIQEHQGELSLGDLYDFVHKNVSKESLLLKEQAEQTPKLSASSSMQSSWRALQIK